MPFSGSKWSICPEQILFGTNHYYYFHLPIGPFQSAKFKNNSYEDAPFLGPQGLICPNEKFSEKLLTVPFIHAYLHAKNQSQILIY